MNKKMGYSLCYQQFPCWTEQRQSSFFARTVRDWNIYITSPGDSWKTIPLSQKCRTSISNNPLLFFLQNISSLSVLQKTATNTSNGARLSICIMEEVSLLTLDLIDLSVQFPNSHTVPVRKYLSLPGPSCLHYPLPPKYQHHSNESIQLTLCNVTL